MALLGEGVFLTLRTTVGGAVALGSAPEYDEHHYSVVIWVRLPVSNPLFVTVASFRGAP